MRIAPYNNSMRLGQGFNSYTQQICLDKAVLIDPTWTPSETRDAITLNHSAAKARETPSQSSEDLNYQLIDKIGEWEQGRKPKEASDPDSESAAADDTDTDITKKKLVGASGEVAKKIEGDIRRDELIHAQRDAKSATATDATRSELVNGKSGETEQIEVPPWVKPQIVSYSSRFVDKISDVTDAMNISGSVSIKTATIGGKANGSYVDSDKFKSSDINYHLQVRVTNQIHNAPRYAIFNNSLALEKSKFAEVYGDSFISGWEEGGELNAIISMKVMDKSKIWEIKAGLEAELSTGAIAGSVKGNFAMEKNNLSKQTETTIAVSWSGGGSIKDPSQDWSITTLKKAAAAFPDLVAITPQRTYAILTKYTALYDFQMKNKEFSPLSYDNAGIYTGALLDAYMDYKSLWKQISIATYELEGNRASIELGQPSEDLYQLAKIKPLPKAQAEPTTSVGPISTATSNASSVVNGEPDALVHLNMTSEQIRTSAPDKDVTQFPVFPPSFAGLVQARRVCRFEMAKIVNEVDLVSRNPDLATDTRRDSFFLNPLVYKQLLPIVRSLSPESAALGAKDPNAALLLGYLQPVVDDRNLPPLVRLDGNVKLESKLEETMFKLRSRAHDYQLRGCAGKTSGIHSGAKAFNDLERLDGTYRPSSVAVWSKDNKIQGLQIQYANWIISHGKTEGAPSHSLDLAHDGSEGIVEVAITQDTTNKIAAIKLATSKCNVLDTTISSDPDKAPPPITGKTLIWSKPDERNWTLRGFFGFTFEDKSEASGPVDFSSLGVIWGKDSFAPVPTRPLQAPLSKGFLNLSADLQRNVRDLSNMYPQYLDKFLMGDAVSTTGGAAVVGDVKPFNALNKIDLNWLPRSISFAAKDRALTGLLVKYTNGEEFAHGAYAEQDRIWTADVKSELVVARISAGKLAAGQRGYVDTLEFVQGDAQGRVPAWPLDTSMLRYLGTSKGERVKVEVSEVLESAPTAGKGRWSIRGFYGEVSGGIIVRLGVIWGRG